MKRKLEFPLFFLVWMTAVGELTLSVGSNCMVQITVIGGVCFVCMLAFLWGNSEEDETISILLKPLIYLMGGAILISTVVSRSPVMLCVLGPELLILLGVERGYSYGHAYES